MDKNIELAGVTYCLIDTFYYLNEMLPIMKNDLLIFDDHYGNRKSGYLVTEVYSNGLYLAYYYNMGIAGRSNIVKYYEINKKIEIDGVRGSLYRQINTTRTMKLQEILDIW